MNRYTIYCNESQTKKAIELGAPIQEVHTVNNYGITTAWKRINPTAEQMFGWLEEQGLRIDAEWSWAEQITMWVWHKAERRHIYTSYGNSRKEATLAAIDAALDYLISNKK